MARENWFADIQSQFPWPFNVVPVDLSWTLSTWAELIGAALLILGLATRFTAISLGVVTWVATPSPYTGPANGTA